MYSMCVCYELLLSRAGNSNPWPEGHFWTTTPNIWSMTKCKIIIYLFSFFFLLIFISHLIAYNFFLFM